MCPRPRSVHKDEQILKAATELFSSKGFANVTVPEIAAQARVGLGTLYLRFASKEALGNAVFRWCKRAWAAATINDWPAHEAPAVQFQTYWARLQAFAEKERSKLLYLETHPMGHALDKQSAALRDELSVRSAELVQGWIDAGDVRALPLEVVGALIHGTFWQVANLPLPPRRRGSLLRQARDAVWRALSA